jgi:hypothetical protein
MANSVLARKETPTSCICNALYTSQGLFTFYIYVTSQCKASYDGLI